MQRFWEGTSLCLDSAHIPQVKQTASVTQNPRLSFATFCTLQTTLEIRSVLLSPVVTGFPNSGSMVKIKGQDLPCSFIRIVVFLSLTWTDAFLSVFCIPLGAPSQMSLKDFWSLRNLLFTGLCNLLVLREGRVQKWTNRNCLKCCIVWFQLLHLVIANHIL